MAPRPKKKLSDDKNKIAERLKKAREALKLTQQQVANKARVSRSAIVHYEKGTVIPGGPELIGLAHALNMTPNYILSGSEDFFASTAPEHALAAKEANVHFRAAKVAICMQALEREVAEALSSLAMALVKTRVPPSDYAEVVQAIEGVAQLSADMRPEIEAMVDKKEKDGTLKAFTDSLTKPPRKRKARPRK